MVNLSGIVCKTAASAGDTARKLACSPRQRKRHSGLTRQGKGKELSQSWCVLDLLVTGIAIIVGSVLCNPSSWKCTGLPCALGTHLILARSKGRRCSTQGTQVSS